MVSRVVKRGILAELAMHAPGSKSFLRAYASILAVCLGAATLHVAPQSRQMQLAKKGKLDHAPVTRLVIRAWPR